MVGLPGDSSASTSSGDAGDEHQTTITFLNHASFLVDHGGHSLLVDPYLSGPAFNDGWRLLSEQVHDQLDTPTFIWYSHEHPDHFSPEFLRNIPADRRPSITVLYQRTRDGRVRRFCARLGYRFVELTDGKELSLGDDFSVTCGRIPFYDSWLLINAGGTAILNTNDCILETDERLRLVKRHAPRCDVLFTQFSYANWMGGPNDQALRRSLADEKLRRVAIQCAAFEPLYVVPFASFVYFSNDENGYMNDEINSVRRAADYIARETSSIPVVLRPNERWIPGTQHDNEHSLAFWDASYRALTQGDLPVARPGHSISADELKIAADGMRSRVGKTNNLRLLRLISRAKLLPTTVFDVNDLGQIFSFDWANGLEVQAALPDDRGLVVGLHSESLLFLLQNDFGVDTLNVNARFTGTVKAKKAMIRNFGVLSLNNTGRYLKVRSAGTLLDPTFVKQGLRTVGLLRSKGQLPA